VLNHRRCPYCARVLHVGDVSRHVRRCVDNPNVQDRLRAKLDVGEGFGIVREEYLMSYIAEDLPPLKALKQRYGNAWGDVLGAFGLKVQPKTWTPRKAMREQRWEEVGAEIDAAVAADRAAALEEAVGRGMPVCRVRPARGGGVAYELR
jgi:hypothetical protein